MRLTLSSTAGARHVSWSCSVVPLTTLDGSAVSCRSATGRVGVGCWWLLVVVYLLVVGGYWLLLVGCCSLLVVGVFVC